MEGDDEWGRGRGERTAVARDGRMVEALMGLELRKKKDGVGRGVGGGVACSTATYRARWKWRAGVSLALGTSVLACCHRCFLRVPCQQHTSSPIKRSGSIKAVAQEHHRIAKRQDVPSGTGKAAQEGRSKRRRFRNPYPSAESTPVRVRRKQRGTGERRRAVRRLEPGRKRTIEGKREGRSGEVKVRKWLGFHDSFFFFEINGIFKCSVELCCDFF